MKIVFVLALWVMFGIGFLGGLLASVHSINNSYKVGYQDAVDTFIMPNTTIVVDGKQYRVTELD